MAVDCNETQWRSTGGGESTDTTKEKFYLFFFLETQKAFNLKRTQVTESYVFNKKKNSSELALW